MRYQAALRPERAHSITSGPVIGVIDGAGVRCSVMRAPGTGARSGVGAAARMRRRPVAAARNGSHAPATAAETAGAVATRVVGGVAGVVIAVGASVRLLVDPLPVLALLLVLLLLVVGRRRTLLLIGSRWRVPGSGRSGAPQPARPAPVVGVLRRRGLLLSCRRPRTAVTLENRRVIDDRFDQLVVRSRRSQASHVPGR